MQDKKKRKKRGRPKKTTAEEVREAKALVPIETKAKEDDGVEGEIIDQDRFGRFRSINKEVLNRLLEAFAWGCSNREAALYAGISERTLISFNKEDAEFKERCEELKLTPVLMARKRIVDSAAKSAFYAIKLLERLKSEEWSLRMRATFEEPDPITPEEQEIIDDIFDENL